MAEMRQFYYQYDLGANTYKYGRIASFPVQGQYGVYTVGSSTTVVSTGAANAFGPVKVGDIIVFMQFPETQTIRKVATKVSNAEITVDTAIDLSLTGSLTGWPGWFFYPFTIGATTADGWHHVSALREKEVLVNIATLNAVGGMDISIEGLGADFGSTPIVLLEKHYAAAITDDIVVPEVLKAIRVGVKATALFAGADSITIELMGRTRRG